MTASLKLLESPVMMWLCDAFGVALAMVGIVTATSNQQIAGFSPITWIVLGWFSISA
jgi:hypothetical protein